MKVSVIIPALNEVGSIETVLSQIPKEGIDEILVIDGHSTDGTVELVKKLGYPVIFQKGKGFGAAISTGVEAAKGDVIVSLTSDNSQNPKDIPDLLRKIDEGYDLVMASRYLPGAGSEDDTLLHHIGNKFFTWLCNFIHKTKITDSLYFFVAFRKDIFKIIEPKNLHCGYGIEMPIRAYNAGLKIAEIPSFERKRFAGKAKISAFSDGFKILKTILKQ